jgi:ribosomal protein S21
MSVNVIVKVDPSQPIEVALTELRRKMGRSGTFRELRRRRAFPALGRRRRAKHAAALKHARKLKRRSELRQAQYDGR